MKSKLWTLNYMSETTNYTPNVSMSPICGPEVFIHAYREMLEVESWETSYPTLGGTSKNISILLFRFS